MTTIQQAVSISLPRPACGLGIAEYMAHASVWSHRTFGPGARQAGVVAHIRKELIEIEDEPEDLSEWADLFILGLDGCWRAMIDWDDPHDVPGAREWYEVEDDILDLLVCAGSEGDDTAEDWPDMSAVEALLDEIEGPPDWIARFDGEIPVRVERRAIDFLFRLVALQAILGARVLGVPYAHFREAVFSKLESNMARQWPDWRTMSPDQPIEHIRSEAP